MEKGEKISQKIQLLRECDNIKIVSYIESISILNLTQPTLIILYCNNSDNIKIVKEIRNLESLNKVPVIFVSDTYSENMLLYAFDNGIDDFFFLDNPDSIILIRIFLTLQKSILYRQIEINNQILYAGEFIEKDTGIYLKDKADVVFRNFFSSCIEDNTENAIFLYIKAVSNDHKRPDIKKIGKTIKNTLRGNDIVAYGKYSGYYIILYNTTYKGVESVITRLNTKLNGICKIYANAAEITASFDEMEPILYQNIKQQIEENIEYKYIQEVKINNYKETLEIKDENGKNFKDFKKEFFTNIEKIITPAFYQVKVTNEDKIANTKIRYEINEEESKFIISKEGLESELNITYPSYIKIIIDIKHIEQNGITNIRRLTYDIEDFSEEILSSILTDMIEEFGNKNALNTIYTEKIK